MGAVADGEEVKSNPDGELALGALLLASPVEEIALGAALGAMANPSKGNGDRMKRRNSRGHSPGYVSNPTKAGEVTVEGWDGTKTTTTAVVIYGDVAALQWNGKYNVMHVPRGAAFISGIRLKRDAVDAARFYGQAPEGVKLLSQALSRNREAYDDLREGKSLRAWKERGKKTEKRVYQPKYWVLVVDEKDPFGIAREEEQLPLDSLYEAVAYVLGIQDRLEASEGKFVMVEIEERTGNVRKNVLLHKRLRENDIFRWYEWPNVDYPEAHVVRPPIARKAKPWGSLYQ